MLVLMLVLVLVPVLLLMLYSDTNGCRWPRSSRRSVARRAAPALQRAVIGAGHIEVIAVLAAARVRGARMAFDAALVAEIALEAGQLAEV